MIAMRSWHHKVDAWAIVPLLHEPVTSFQPDVVVTDQGVAELFGVTSRRRPAH